MLLFFNKLINSNANLVLDSETTSFDSFFPQQRQALLLHRSAALTHNTATARCFLGALLRVETRVAVAKKGHRGEKVVQPIALS